MKIRKEITINDEPLISQATGKRKAVINYDGPKYLYLELNSHTNKIEAVAHSAESVPDPAGAQERLTPIDGREIVELDAEDKTIAAAHFWSHHSVEVSDYTEVLENGETYEYKYDSTPVVGEIFDFNNMRWNKAKNDFDEYKFILAPNSDAVINSSIDMLVEKVNKALVENTALTNEQKTEINQYINDLHTFKANTAKGIENWKMAFPACKVAY